MDRNEEEKKATKELTDMMKKIMFRALGLTDADVQKMDASREQANAVAKTLGLSSMDVSTLSLLTGELIKLETDTLLLAQRRGMLDCDLEAAAKYLLALRVISAQTVDTLDVVKDARDRLSPGQ